MKSYKRYLSLLCVFVLLFAVFSVPANAEEIDVQPYTIDFRTYIKKVSDNSNWKSYNLLGFDPTDDIVNKTTASPIWIGKISDIYVQNVWYFYPKGNEPMIKAGGEVTTLLLKSQANVLLQYMNSSQSIISNAYDRDLQEIRLYVTYTDGTYEWLDNNGKISVVNTNNHNFEFKFTPTKDIERFTIYSKNTFAEPSISYAQTEVNVYLGDYFETEGGWTLSISQDSKEVGLLGGIIEWIKSIFNKIGDIFDTIVNGFSSVGEWFSNLGSSIGEWLSNVVNTIIELPFKLGELLESLFVPSQEDISGLYDTFDNMLAEKFGAVYQAGQLIIDFFEEMTIADLTNTIEFPKTTIDLPNNNKFSFGGYDVKVVPNGFDFIATAIKTIVGVICTIGFVNGLRKRYDEVMGVEQ